MNLLDIQIHLSIEENKNQPWINQYWCLKLGRYLGMNYTGNYFLRILAIFYSYYFLTKNMIRGNAALYFIKICGFYDIKIRYSRFHCRFFIDFINIIQYPQTLLEETEQGRLLRMKQIKAREARSPLRYPNKQSISR